jgi:hypothetical protein
MWEELKKFVQKYHSYFEVDMLLYIFMILLIMVLFGGWGLGWWGN